MKGHALLQGGDNSEIVYLKRLPQVSHVAHYHDHQEYIGFIGWDLDHFKNNFQIV